MSGAITAVAATIGAMTMAEAFTAVAVVGGIVGAVGAVTHTKELQYAGMALGAVGGIGALAVSSGIFAGAGLGEIAAGTTAAETASPFLVATDAGTWAGEGAAAAAGGAADWSGTAMNASPDVVTMANGGAWSGAGSAMPGSTSSDVNVNAAAPVVAPGEAAPWTANGLSTDVMPGAASGGQTTLPDYWDHNTFDIPQGAEPPGMTAPGDVARTAGRPDDVSGAPWTPQQDRMGQVTTVDPERAQPAITPRSAATPAPTTGGNAPLLGSTATPPAVEPAVMPAWDRAAGIAASSGRMVVDPLTGQAVGNGVWDSIKGIISTPGVGLLGLGALQGISSFISGATSTLTPAQVELYRAQAQQNLASSNLATQQADMLTLQRQNMGGNLPVATRTPVTGAPVPSGLINSTPPRPAPVTGQVA